jgi:phytanoyl-CoA hydroxylase
MTAPTRTDVWRTPTDDAVRMYHEQGFLHVPGVLSPEEVVTYRAACEELLTAEEPVIWGPNEAESQVHYVEEAWLKHDALRELALHPRITAVARRLAGVPLRLYSSDVLMKKPGKALPTMVHDDEAGLPLAKHQHTLTAWIALVDVPVERGCLSFVPGSHLRGEVDRQIHMASFADYRPMGDVWPSFDWQPRVTVPLRAGDVSFHHFRTIHMAGANVSDTARIANGVIYMDDGATYWPGVQDQYLTHLEAGQRVEGDTFPLIDGAVTS